MGQRAFLRLHRHSRVFATQGNDADQMCSCLGVYSVPIQHTIGSLRAWFAHFRQKTMTTFVECTVLFFLWPEKRQAQGVLLSRKKSQP